MAQPTFSALRVYETRPGVFERRIEQQNVADLPAGEVLISVAYSSLNYKDALAATGNKGVSKTYPHTPGIDAAGVVEQSSSPAFTPGQDVLVTGYDLGMGTAGGFGQYVRVPADWVVPMPAGLTLFESMALGTAGFTAAQAVSALLHAGLTPPAGEVLVSGASGGVGSLAVALLARLGFTVVAASGKADAGDYLKGLGAATIIGRGELVDESERPLLKGRWGGVVDTCGGAVLATAVRMLKHRGAVASCGLVASPQLNLTVFPFILRGASLIGIDSATCPMPERLEIWRKLAGEWKIAQLARLAQSCDLAELDSRHIAAILAGKMRGRMVVKLR